MRKNRIHGLTAREWEVAKLVGNKKTNPQITTLLGFKNQQSVKNHLHNIFLTLKIKRRAELVHWVKERLKEETDGEYMKELFLTANA